MTGDIEWMEWMERMRKAGAGGGFVMTDDLVERIHYANAMFGLSPIMATLMFDVESRVRELEGQREVDAGLMAGMKAVIKQLEEQLRSANLSIAVLQDNAVEAHEVFIKGAIDAAVNAEFDVSRTISKLRKP